MDALDTWENDWFGIYLEQYNYNFESIFISYLGMFRLCLPLHSNY